MRSDEWYLAYVNRLHRQGRLLRRRLGSMTFLYGFAAIAAFWMGAPLGAIVGNIFFLIIMAAFAGMKATDFIDWSWWWVALPLWSYAGATFGRYWFARTSA